MKNLYKQLGIIALTAVIVFTMAACGGDSGGGGGGGGGGASTFTLTGIPSEYNGKYAIVQCASPLIVGVKNYDSSSPDYKKLLPISKGSVSIPLWTLTGQKIAQYSGNDDVMLVVQICDSETYTKYEDSLCDVVFLSVTFKNGSATKAWKDGTVQKK